MSGDQYDAIELLRADHQRIGFLFSEFEKYKHTCDYHEQDHCTRMVESACVELRLHGMLEWEFFYPGVRYWAGEELKQLLEEAEVELEIIEQLLDKMSNLETTDTMYKATFTVLVDHVRRHIQATERQIFPLVREVQEVDPGILGKAMQIRREELLDQISEIEDDIYDEEEELAMEHGAPEHEYQPQPSLN